MAVECPGLLLGEGEFRHHQVFLALTRRGHQHPPVCGSCRCGSCGAEAPLPVGVGLGSAGARRPGDKRACF